MLTVRPAADPIALHTLELLAADVREQVKQHAIDPLTDVPAVRRLAESAVRAYDDRSLRGLADPLQEPTAVIHELVSRISGFGQLQRYLDDPTVEEIWVNEPSRVFIARDGRHELTTTVLSAVEVRDLVERMLKTSGRRVDMSSPFVDAMLPAGHRLHVVLDGITRGFTALNIRKFVVRAHNLDELVELGTMTAPAGEFLRACVIAGLNILVSGGTQAGKTTLLNTLASAVPGRERVISVEEVYELQLQHPDWVAMQTRQAGLEGNGEIALRALVKESLRMRPSRIVVGEVRAEECLDLLLALNSGLPGMATVHANSAREALVKLCTLPLLAGENISARFVVPTVASCIDIVVQVEVDADGRRRVRDIVAVPGRVEADVIETEPVFSLVNGRLLRGHGMPPHLDRFERVGLDIHRLLQPTGDPAAARVG